mgnify:CR=1 FL=1
MDPYSFLNTAHTAFFAELYNEYLLDPDSVEPSWRAFFQGFEFGIDKKSKNEDFLIPENILKEFRVVELINAYRSRGHLFTKTNPVRERRKYVPTLDLENFGLSNEDLQSTFNAGEIIGIGNSSLENILIHLERIYCDSIGIEYMYIRTPERIKWIQSFLNKNDNHPEFDIDKNQIDREMGYKNFAVNLFTFQTLENLNLKRAGHRRAIFEWLNNDVKKNWLIP